MSFLVRIRLRKDAPPFLDAAAGAPSLLRALRAVDYGNRRAFTWLQNNVREILDAKEESDEGQA